MREEFVYLMKLKMQAASDNIGMPMKIHMHPATQSQCVETGDHGKLKPCYKNETNAYN